MAGHTKWSEIKRKGNKVTRKTIYQMPEDVFEDATITSVRLIERTEDDEFVSWEFTMDEGLSFWIDGKYGVEPKVGDIVRTYGDGFGSPVRGLAINGEVIYYKTVAEHKAEWEEQSRQHKAKMYQEYVNNAPQREQTIALFPQVFKAHLDKMRRNNPTFWEIEPYEVFCLSQALDIANAFGDPEKIREFAKMDSWEEQLALVPTLDGGHSGNTFGYACQAAYVYLTEPENIKHMHAAMAILNGCFKAGCHTREDFPDMKEE